MASRYAACGGGTSVAMSWIKVSPSTGFVMCASNPASVAAIPVTHVPVAGDGDGEDFAKSGLAADSREKLAAVHVWHRDVQQQHIRRPRPEKLQRLARVARRSHRRAFVGDDLAENREGVGVVVRHENRDSAQR
jgi:hypothetical protein